MPRRCKDWITDYLKYITPASESPVSYNFCCAATSISSAVKRNVYVQRGSWRLYPNLFTILVGRPGIGKGSAINPVCSILRESGIANILSDRITIEYMLERMAQGWTHTAKTSTGALKLGQDHTCLIKSTEFSVFASASQNTLPILTDLWDSNEGEYLYGTRHKGELRIK